VLGWSARYSSGGNGLPESIIAFIRSFVELRHPSGVSVCEDDPETAKPQPQEDAQTDLFESVAA
jgi:hypothetical protein